MMRARSPDRCGFYERIRARRGPQIAITATGRRLSLLLWHLLTREQDYAFAMPSQVQRMLCALLQRATRHVGSLAEFGWVLRLRWYLRDDLPS